MRRRSTAARDPRSARRHALGQPRPAATPPRSDSTGSVRSRRQRPKMAWLSLRVPASPERILGRDDGSSMLVRRSCRLHRASRRASSADVPNPGARRLLSATPTARPARKRAHARRPPHRRHARGGGAPARGSPAAARPGDRTRIRRVDDDEAGRRCGGRAVRGARPRPHPASDRLGIPPPASGRPGGRSVRPGRRVRIRFRTTKRYQVPARRSTPRRAWRAVVERRCARPGVPRWRSSPPPGASRVAPRAPPRGSARARAARRSGSATAMVRAGLSCTWPDKATAGDGSRGASAPSASAGSARRVGRRPRDPGRPARCRATPARGRYGARR